MVFERYNKYDTRITNESPNAYFQQGFFDMISNITFISFNDNAI